MWPVWILLVAWDTACNTDLCWGEGRPRERQNFARGPVNICPTCEELCAGCTTWVGTPGPGGLESDKLSE